MNRTTVSRTVVVCLTVLLLAVGCGGGGGGGSGIPFWGGIWRGSVQKVSDSCPFESPASFSFEHTINQVEREVVVDVRGGGSFRGTVNAENDGFLVLETTTRIINGVVCSGDSGIAYSGSPNETNGVGLGLQITCTNILLSLSCEVLYSGTSRRVS